MNEQAKESGTHFVEVKVHTTAGAYPDNSYDRVPVNQPVRHELQETAKKLKITDITGWIATVNGQELNVDASYRDNGLTTGKIDIDFGPREGGGGHA